MITVNVRKQGGAAVITIPSDVLKLLNIQIGSELVLAVNEESFVARPLKTKQRYSLSELLQGVSEKEMVRLNKNTEWAREGKSIGTEIA
jgi:antitoxin ChpS